jgi:hypothetical protein
LLLFLNSFVTTRPDVTKLRHRRCIARSQASGIARLSEKRHPQPGNNEMYASAGVFVHVTTTHARLLRFTKSSRVLKALAMAHPAHCAPR